MSTVLVVDDDVEVRRLLSAWLKSVGFRIILASDGYQGVQFARTEQPDVILLDINMPAADGFTVNDRLNRMGNLGLTPIIYMSADHAAESRALATGARTFLAKPLKKETVMKAIEDAIAA